jgi:phosphatidate cytidylyltransferase
MLKQRVLTAVVLLATLATAIALGRAAFGGLLLALLGATAFEWLRLVPLGKAIALAVAAALAAALAWALLPQALPAQWVRTTLSAALLLWFAVAALVVRAARVTVSVPPPVNAAAGVLLLTAAAVGAFALLRDSVTLLLSAMAVVWVADTAAYFAGRRWGKAKLAPRISPGKTWAGVWGAMAGVASLALLLYWVAPQWRIFTTVVLQRLSLPLGLLTLCGLVALSVVGDLFESLLKRQAGVKDSGTLLPGHGGVFDRIDAQLPVLPVSALILAVSA